MNEVPKKIWVDAELDVYDYEEQGSQPYIRADIVDELVEALKWMTNILVVETETAVKAIDRAEAALKKLEGI